VKALPLAYDMIPRKSLTLTTCHQIWWNNIMLHPESSVIAEKPVLCFRKRHAVHQKTARFLSVGSSTDVKTFFVFFIFVDFFTYFNVFFTFFQRRLFKKL